MLLGEITEPAAKKTKGSSYFVPELCYILATCDERIPLVYLGEEVNTVHFIADGEVHVCMCLLKH